MTRRNKITAEQMHEAREQLRELFPRGSHVTTLVRHVSASGMSRSISVLAIQKWESAKGPRTDINDVSYLVARATGDTIDQTRGGVKVHGSGMDMAFDLVYRLSVALYCPDKYDHDAAYALTNRTI